MRRSVVRMCLAAALLLVPVMGRTPAAAQYDNYPYPPGSWQYGFPQSWDRIGDVLRSIERPSRRSEVAENWIQFSKSAIAKDLEYRDRWLNLQKEQLNQNQRVEQQRVEMGQLQMQIEQLRAANLRLERENLELQMALKNPTAAPDAGRSDKANATTTTAPTSERAP
ncbi:MAG: hypothetical protein ACM3VT_13140 [Solirubrobacterales bacterium]